MNTSGRKALRKMAKDLGRQHNVRKAVGINDEKPVVRYQKVGAWLSAKKVAQVV